MKFNLRIAVSIFIKRSLHRYARRLFIHEIMFIKFTLFSFHAFRASCFTGFSGGVFLCRGDDADLLVERLMKKVSSQFHSSLAFFTTRLKGKILADEGRS